MKTLYKITGILTLLFVLSAASLSDASAKHHKGKHHKKHHSKHSEKSTAGKEATTPVDGQ